MLLSIFYRLLQGVFYRVLLSTFYRILQRVLYRVLLSILYRLLQGVFYKVLLSIFYRLLQGVFYRVLPNIFSRVLQGVGAGAATLQRSFLLHAGESNAPHSTVQRNTQEQWREVQRSRVGCSAAV